MNWLKTLRKIKSEQMALAQHRFLHSNDDTRHAKMMQMIEELPAEDLKDIRIPEAYASKTTSDDVPLNLPTA